MSTMAQIQTKTGRTTTELRRWLLYAAGSVLVFGPLHHVDHIIRGNHVGWPVIAAVTPFTFSLLVYPFLLLGLYLTARGRAWAGYWLGFGLGGPGARRPGEPGDQLAGADRHRDPRPAALGALVAPCAHGMSYAAVGWR